jgi:hypothetical protein
LSNTSMRSVTLPLTPPLISHTFDNWPF